MTLVAFESSVRPASIAVRRGGRTVTTTLVKERAHASDLLPALKTLLEEVDAQAAEIDGVIVGTGPGSFTGLRVGIATALGFVRGNGARIYGVPSTETLAYGTLAPGEEAVVLLDARGRELYFARYRRTEHEVEIVKEPCITTADELAQLLPEGDAPILGDPTVAEAARLSAADIARLRTDLEPRAESLLELGARRLERDGGMAPGDVQPLYLRPYAVRPRRR